MSNTPSPAGLVASCRAFALQCQPYGVATVLNDAADEIERLQEAAMQGVNLGIATGLEMAADPTRDAAIEEAAKVVDELAEIARRAGGTPTVDISFVERIAQRIRALSTPTSGEASAPPPLSEQTLTAGAGHTPSSAAESGADAREDLIEEVEHALEEMKRLSPKHQAALEQAGYSKSAFIEFYEKIRAALASSPTEQMREALNKAREFAVLFIAFDGRDRNTDRMDRTLDEMRNLAVETDECIRQALGGNHD